MAFDAPQPAACPDAQIRHWFEVEIGAIYIAKIGGILRPVRILRQYIEGGHNERKWVAKNLETGRLCRIGRATRLRRRLGERELFERGLA